MSLPLSSDLARQQLLYASGQMQFPTHLNALEPIEKQYLVFSSEETHDWVIIILFTLKSYI